MTMAAIGQSHSGRHGRHASSLRIITHLLGAFQPCTLNLWLTAAATQAPCTYTPHPSVLQTPYRTVRDRSQPCRHLSAVPTIEHPRARQYPHGLRAACDQR